MYIYIYCKSLQHQVTQGTQNPNSSKLTKNAISTFLAPVPARTDCGLDIPPWCQAAASDDDAATGVLPPVKLQDS